MKRAAIILLFVSLLCLGACGGTKTPAPSGSPSPSESGSPSPSSLPVSSKTAVKALLGKWKNPAESYPYYYNFTDDTHVYMHHKAENGVVSEVLLQYRANDGDLYITTDGEDEASCVVIFHYTYIIKGTQMEMKEVGAGAIDEKTLSKIS